MGIDYLIFQSTTKPYLARLYSFSRSSLFDSMISILLPYLSLSEHIGGEHIAFTRIGYIRAGDMLHNISLQHMFKLRPYILFPDYFRTGTEPFYHIPCNTLAYSHLSSVEVSISWVIQFYLTRVWQFGYLHHIFYYPSECLAVVLLQYPQLLLQSQLGNVYLTQVCLFPCIPPIDHIVLLSIPLEECLGVSFEEVFDYCRMDSIFHQMYEHLSDQMSIVQSILQRIVCASSPPERFSIHFSDNGTVCEAVILVVELQFPIVLGIIPLQPHRMTGPVTQLFGTRQV